MSLASLEAFLEQARQDPRLRQWLAAAPDAAAVAALARAAGFPVSEGDLWQASAASPEEIHPTAASPQHSSNTAPEPSPPSSEGQALPGSAEATAAAGPLPDPWWETEDSLSRFVHQAQGDPELRQALASAPDAAAVAAIAQATGYPISEVDLWLASGASPADLAATPGPSPLEPTSDDGALADQAPSDAIGAEGEWPLARDALGAESPLAEDAPSAREAILRLLEQAQAEEELRQALASAPDAVAVAAIARAAGHPISELALWLASGASFAEVSPVPEPPSHGDDPLTLFLRAVEADPDLQTVLASAPDAATVAALARIAGFPLTAADLWAASDAVPEELGPQILEELFAADGMEGELLLVVEGGLG